MRFRLKLHGRFVRLEPLVPGDRTRLVFGDDEIYVANYLGKKPYDYERPYCARADALPPIRRYSIRVSYPPPTSLDAVPWPARAGQGECLWD